MDTWFSLFDPYLLISFLGLGVLLLFFLFEGKRFLKSRHIRKVAKQFGAKGVYSELGASFSGDYEGLEYTVNLYEDDSFTVLLEMDGEIDFLLDLYPIESEEDAGKWKRFTKIVEEFPQAVSRLKSLNREFQVDAYGIDDLDDETGRFHRELLKLLDKDSFYQDLLSLLEKKVHDISLDKEDLTVTVYGTPGDDLPGFKKQVEDLLVLMKKVKEYI